MTKPIEQWKTEAKQIIDKMVEEMNAVFAVNAPLIADFMVQLRESDISMPMKHAVLSVMESGLDRIGENVETLILEAVKK